MVRSCPFTLFLTSQPGAVPMGLGSTVAESITCAWRKLESGMTAPRASK